MPDEYQSYGVTQNANAELTTADALVGERVSPTPANATVGSPATFSTAPYVPPGRRSPSRVGRCVGKGDTCSAPVVHGTHLCYFHSQSTK
jgi:hypothetical protein